MKTEAMKEESMEESVAEKGGQSKANKTVPNGVSCMTRRSLSGPTKPAELFRTDFITAMKLPDMEPLGVEEYSVITDSWKPDWEKGVQVPVNEEAIKEPSCWETEGYSQVQGQYAFKLPAGKLLHAVCDETYKKSIHELHEGDTLAEQVCRYDLDRLDSVWLRQYNEERLLQGLDMVSEYQLEQAIADFEVQCAEGLTEKMDSVKGVEFDDTVLCDICRSPDAEDTNEMVFCDGCNICVHQACYGIMKVPQGSWLCRICALAIKPECVLCPGTGGAMKCTKNGANWAHVRCALWVPEVGFGDPEKMEPIIRITEVPAARWELTCSVCGEKKGACIQCCVKSCRDAFHVSCAFDANLDMITTVQDGGVRFKPYCKRHSKRREDSKVSTIKQIAAAAQQEDDKAKVKAQKMQEWQDEFYTCVNVDTTVTKLKLHTDTVRDLFAYWQLKRKANFNVPLFAGIKDHEASIDRQKDILKSRRKMFVQLRQNMERLRNLCYLLGRREKERHQLYSAKEAIFEKQVELADLYEDSEWPAPDLPCGPVATAHRSGVAFYDDYDHVVELARRLDGIEAETPDASAAASDRATNSAALLALRKKRQLAQSDYVRRALQSITAAHRSRNNDEEADEDWRPPGECAVTPEGGASVERKKKRAITIPRHLIDDLGIGLDDERKMNARSRSPSTARAIMDSPAPSLSSSSASLTDYASKKAKKKQLALLQGDQLQQQLKKKQKGEQQRVSMGTALSHMKKAKAERQMKRAAEMQAREAGLSVDDLDLADFEVPKPMKSVLLTSGTSGGYVEGFKTVGSKLKRSLSPGEREGEGPVKKRKYRQYTINKDGRRVPIMQHGASKMTPVLHDGKRVLVPAAKAFGSRANAPIKGHAHLAKYAHMKNKVPVTMHHRNDENIVVAHARHHVSMHPHVMRVERKSPLDLLDAMFPANTLVVDDRIKRKVMDRLGVLEPTEDQPIESAPPTSRAQYLIEDFLSSGCATIEGHVEATTPHLLPSLLTFRSSLCWQGVRRTPLRPSWFIGKKKITAVKKPKVTGVAVSTKASAAVVAPARVSTAVALATRLAGGGTGSSRMEKADSVAGKTTTGNGPLLGVVTDAPIVSKAPALLILESNDAEKDNDEGNVGHSDMTPVGMEESGAAETTTSLPSASQQAMPMELADSGVMSFEKRAQFLAELQRLASAAGIKGSSSGCMPGEQKSSRISLSSNSVSGSRDSNNKPADKKSTHSTANSVTKGSTVKKRSSVSVSASGEQKRRSAGSSESRKSQTARVRESHKTSVTVDEIFGEDDDFEDKPDVQHSNITSSLPSGRSNSASTADTTHKTSTIQHKKSLPSISESKSVAVKKSSSAVAKTEHQNPSASKSHHVKTYSRKSLPFSTPASTISNKASQVSSKTTHRFSDASESSKKVSEDLAADAAKFKISVSKKTSGVTPAVICITSSQSLLRLSSGGDKQPQSAATAPHSSDRTDKLLSSTKQQQDKDRSRLTSVDGGASSGASIVPLSPVVTATRVNGYSHSHTLSPHSEKQVVNGVRASPVTLTPSKVAPSGSGGGVPLSSKAAKQKLSFEEALQSATPASVLKKKSDRLSLSKSNSSERKTSSLSCSSHKSGGSNTRRTSSVSSDSTAK